MRTDAAIPWNAYPLLLLALCFAAGLGAAAAAPGIGYGVWAGVAGAGFAFALAARWYVHGRVITPLPLLNLLAASLVVFSVGGARYVVQETLPPHHVSRYAARLSGQPVTLDGLILDEPAVRASGTRFTMQGRQLLTASDTLPLVGAVRVTLSPSRWPPGRSFPAVQQGERVLLQGRLKRPPEKRNPADFDYGRYLRQHGVHATLTVYDAAGVTRVAGGSGWRGHCVPAARAYIRGEIEEHVPTDTGRMVLAALLLGDRSQFDDATRNRFARTGLMHLLAVSGLHVLLVGMVVYELLKPLLVRLRLAWQAVEITRASVTMGLLLAYTVLTGASASTVRAAIMAGLFIGGNVLQRTSNPLNALGTAALALLAGRPSFLFDVGFQLSFAAVAAIVALNPVFVRSLPEGCLAGEARRWFVTMVTTSLAATLGTMPVLLYHFGFASFAGLLLNLPAIPLTMLTLAAGLLMVALGGATTTAGNVLGTAADLLARWLVQTAEVGEAWLSWASIDLTVENPWYMLSLVGLLGVLAQWTRCRIRWRLCAVAMSLAAAGMWVGVLGGTSRPALEVVFFDVGQGDAALVAFPNGRHLLIDAGQRDAYSDQGVRTLLPHLERYGVRQLDAVVITHPHSDHLGGLPALLRAVPIRRVLHNGATYGSALYAETIHLLDSLHVPHKAVAAGDTLVLDSSVRIQVLGPIQAEAGENPNDASVVLRVAYGETVVLFTGDAEAAAEQRLLAHYDALLPSSVVKVGHHGSATSSIPGFVSAVSLGASGSIAIVSVGQNNRYGLPSEDVLDRWQSQGAAVLTTQTEGALWLRSDGQSVRRRHWR